MTLHCLLPWLRNDLRGDILVSLFGGVPGGGIAECFCMLHDYLRSTIYKIYLKLIRFIIHSDVMLYIQMMADPPLERRSQL